MPCSLTCLLTSSRLSATPLSALLLLASFWHFPLLHNRCLMTWERPAGGRLGGLEPPTLCGPAPPRPPYLVGIVKEFQHCEDAGPDEQAHLAPDVSCGFRLERLAGSGRRGRGGDEAQQDGGGGGHGSHVCRDWPLGTQGSENQNLAGFLVYAFLYLPTFPK